MNNHSALHEACSSRDLKDIIVYLLEHGASPNIRNKAGKLPRYNYNKNNNIKLHDDDDNVYITI